MPKEIIINAAGQRVGIVASKVAMSLRGKSTSDYLPHRTILPKVTVLNIDKLDLVEKKLRGQEVQRYSGYPGGRKVKTAYDVAMEDKTKLFLKAVSGMLPSNRLKKIMIKNLVLKHGEQ